VQFEGVQGPKLLCFSFSIIHLHVTSAATHNKCLDKMPMLCFSEERDALIQSIHCLKLECFGFIKHVTEMGMAPEEAKHRMPKHGNCIDCQRVGMVFEPCPDCNEGLEGPPWIVFMAKWTTSHVFLNP
jgi:hypothetical protein